MEEWLTNHGLPQYAKVIHVDDYRDGDVDEDGGDGDGDGDDDCKVDGNDELVLSDVTMKFSFLSDDVTLQAFEEEGWDTMDSVYTMTEVGRRRVWATPYVRTFSSYRRTCWT